MRSTLIILLLASLILGCEPTGPRSFGVSGKLENGAGMTVYLDRLTTTSVNPFTSTVADADGYFVLGGESTEVGFYRLRLGDNNFINVVIHPEDSIEVNGDATYLYGNYIMTGSEDVSVLYELNEYLKRHGITEDSLRQLATSVPGQPVNRVLQMQLQSLFNTNLDERAAFLRGFVDKHVTSIATLAAIEKMDPKADAEYFVKLDKELTELYPNSDYLTNLHLKAVQMAKLVIGAQAPQIVMADPNGEVISLSSFRGKTVLVDFWASWCRPCRAENPQVVKLYEKYKDQGFEIYGVSLDREKHLWIQAIKQDGLEWIHVSDLQFWNSSAAKLYNVNSIPQTYLLDEDGKIIAKDFRAAELEKKLKEIFG